MVSLASESCGKRLLRRQFDPVVGRALRGFCAGRLSRTAGQLAEIFVLVTTWLVRMEL
jgi:hypothetical protein